MKEIHIIQCIRPNIQYATRLTWCAFL